MTELSYPHLTINRLRVMRRGHVAYDQKFHKGVNIIRGENGSGKSTISDFMFYILGGEFDDWKEAAEYCDVVQAEISTPRGKLTLKRDIDSKQTPIDVFFGDFESADQQATEGWERFPIRRSEKQTSFSQVMFRSLKIPEAQSDGASNITMHQLMRLLYSDQRTPAPNLFRFEPFDTQNIREAVGDLICGISGYERYEVNLALRDAERLLAEYTGAYKALVSALPSEESLNTPESINGQLSNLRLENRQIVNDIENVDDIVDQDKNTAFFKERKVSLSNLQRAKKNLGEIEDRLETEKYEILEIEQFLEYLTGLLEKLSVVEETSQSVGSIDFTHCPACLKPLTAASLEHVCTVCSKETDPETDRSKYNQIRLDLEIQTRETRQLLSQKTSSAKNDKIKFRQILRTYESESRDFSIKYDLSSSPREAFLASKNNRIGQIEGEISFLQRSLTLAEEVASLSEKKAQQGILVSELRDRLKALESSISTRRANALTSISTIACTLLKSDLERQTEFENATNVALNFKGDEIQVDGKTSFAESSNVYLKNSAILAMLLAAGKDLKFHHPRFLLFDNIEDKGMEMKRSHRFQRLIVEAVTELKIPYQVIFTTSMMNPELELEDYVIGPHYTHDNRTLDLGIPKGRSKNLV